MSGASFPGFIDHHVHLGLVDASALPSGGIAGVVDLGWSPEIASVAAAAPVVVEYAGQFLAAPGGYPSDRSWAPEGSTCFVAGPVDVEAAVARQVDLGATLVKVTLNAEAGPVPDAALLADLVAATHTAGLPVAAHAQGAGMVELALAAGVDVLAHTPWTTALPQELVVEAAARQLWISTLDIHGYGDRTPDQARALDNLARFHAAGGRVLYGTDLGNGPLPVGLNLREVALLLEAGLSPDHVLVALSHPWPRTPAATPDGPRTVVPGDQPTPGTPEWVAWLGRARCWSGASAPKQHTGG